MARRWSGPGLVAVLVLVVAGAIALFVFHRSSDRTAVERRPYTAHALARPAAAAAAGGRVEGEWHVPGGDYASTRYSDLADITDRNVAQLMERWIAHPQSVVPGNAMPDLPMTELDSRDLAAFLYSRT